MARGVHEALPKGPLYTGHGKREQHGRLCASLGNALGGRKKAGLMGKGAGQQRMLFITQPPGHGLM
eukprot:898566-Amphidinium_carterae.2